MGTETLVVARTDADSATLIDTHVDPRDHPYILGATVPGLPSLNEAVAAAHAAGRDVAAAERDWMARARPLRASASCPPSPGGARAMPRRGDTVDEETAKRKGEDAPRRAHAARAHRGGDRPGASR